MKTRLSLFRECFVRGLNVVESRNIRDRQIIWDAELNPIYLYSPNGVRKDVQTKSSMEQLGGKETSHFCLPQESVQS